MKSLSIEQQDKLFQIRLQLLIESERIKYTILLDSH